MRAFRLPPWLTPLAVRGAHLAARVLHPLTVGVRAAVFDPQGRVLLVKHSYIPGWHLPGGGVEPGETVREAIARELREEGNVEIEGEPVLHGVFFNRAQSRRDHVLVFVVRQFRPLGPRLPDWEIVDTGFFDPERLPEGMSPASAARLREIRTGTPPPPDW